MEIQHETVTAEVMPEVMPSNMPTAMPELRIDFDSLREWIEAETAKAANIEPTENNRVRAKNVRASLASFAKKLTDAKRITKQTLLAPFEPYERKIDELITIVESHRLPLDGKIKAIEQGLRDKQAEELTEYLTQQVQANFDGHWARAEYWNTVISANPKLTALSTSLNAAKKEVDKIVEDKRNALTLISETYESDKTLLVVAVAEFAKTFSASLTIEKVNAYKREQQAIADRLREVEASKQAEEVEEARCNELIEEQREEKKREVQEVAQSELYTLTLKLTGTREQLRSLRRYIDAQGIKFCKIGEVEKAN